SPGLAGWLATHRPGATLRVSACVRAGIGNGDPGPDVRGFWVTRTRPEAMGLAKPGRRTMEAAHALRRCPSRGTRRSTARTPGSRHGCLGPERHAHRHRPRVRDDRLGYRLGDRRTAAG